MDKLGLISCGIHITTKKSLIMTNISNKK